MASVGPGYDCVNSLNKKMKSEWRLLCAVPRKGKAGNATWAGKEGCKQRTKGTARDPASRHLLPYLLVPTHDLGQGLLCSPNPFSLLFLYECQTNAKLNAKVKIHFTGIWHAERHSISGNRKLVCCDWLMENVKLNSVVKNPNNLFSLQLWLSK